MPRIRPLSTALRCALIGGGASIPLTLGLYWLSGTGSDLSLNMVFVGALIGGVAGFFGAKLGVWLAANDLVPGVPAAGN